MSNTTVYFNREFVNVGFLKSIGLIHDEKKFFKSVSDVHKLKVLQDSDMVTALKYAEIKDASLVDWVIPVSGIRLSSVDEQMFKEQGYLNLVAREKIMNKMSSSF